MKAKPKAILGLASLMALMVMLNATPVSAQTSPLEVTYTVHLDPSFKLYGYLTEQVNLNLSGQTVPGNPTTVVVTMPFTYTAGPFGLPTGSTQSISSSVFQGNPSTTIIVGIPGNVTSFSVRIQGSVTGLSSVFFKDLGVVPAIFASSSTSPSTVVNVLVPIGSLEIRSVYPASGGQQVTINGQSYLQVTQAGLSTPRGVTILYQSSLSDYYAFLTIIAIAAIAVIVPLLLIRFKPKIISGWRRLPGVLKSGGDFVFRRRGSKALLAAFVAVCLAMILLGTVFGPPPQPRAYLAASPSSSGAIEPYIAQAGWSYLTAGDAADGFSRTSGLGTFSAAIIADFPPPVLASSPSQEGLSNVPYVIILSQYAPPGYAGQVMSTRGGVILVDNQNSLVGILAQIGGRQNALGLSISEGVYHRAEQLVGALSLLVPFFALAFLSSNLIDLRGRGFSAAFDAIAYVVMTYFIAEFAFIVTTVMLGTPVAMHAAISNKETAEGLLGPFGGGTRPREVAGIFGFLFGVWYNRKGAFSYDRAVVIAISAAAVIVILDPLNIASQLFELLLAVSSNVGIGASGPAYEFLRGLIGQPLTLFQSYITPGFVGSHGAALFFLSALPFVLYSRVGKGTGTLLILFAALGCGLGMDRIADMIPMETIASIAPGLLIGVLLLPVFWAGSRLETIVRRISPFS